MFVLTRKKGETICIGDDIRITVVKLTENRVELSIDAPRDVPVHRGSVAERIERRKSL